MLAKAEDAEGYCMQDSEMSTPLSVPIHRLPQRPECVVYPSATCYCLISSDRAFVLIPFSDISFSRFRSLFLAARPRNSSGASLYVSYIGFV